MVASSERMLRGLVSGDIGIFIFLKKSRKQSIDFTGGLHILDEELLFPKI
jgi:hypothetical protein